MANPLVAHLKSSVKSNAPLPQQTASLKQMFARLTDPNESPVSIRELTGILYEDLKAERQTLDVNNPRFTTFAQACVDAGIVRTMMAIAWQEWPGTDDTRSRYMSQYWCIECLASLMRLGDVGQRRSMLDELLQGGILNLCLRNLREDRLSLMRQSATYTLHLLAVASPLGEKISAAAAAEIIEVLCMYVLEGPNHAVSQMWDRSTTWQSSMMMGREDIHPSQSSKFAHRFYAMGQDSAIQAAHGIICTTPPQSRQVCLEIVKRKPHIFDLLLDCAILERPRWYPESQVGHIACELLVLLFHWPGYMVPGVTPLDRGSKNSDWKAMLQTMTIFTSRPDWAEKIHEVWMRIQEEDMETVMRNFSRVVPDYAAFDEPGPESFAKVAESRGTCRVCILRIISTLTHAAESCGITNAHIESFLHIAYLGCRKGGKYPEDCRTQKELLASLEHEEEVFAHPHEVASGHTPTEDPFAVAPQRVLGPTTLIRLLTILAQRKALTGIQTLRKPPNGLSSSTSLSHIQLITHPDVIRRAIKISQRRILDRIDRGRKRQASGKDDPSLSSACSIFTSAGELAAALLALDEHTEKIYSAEIRGARKQLVITLGNAAQMMLNLRHYQRAYHLAICAVNAAEGIPANENLDPEVVEKNKRRVDQASAELRQHR
ncbi:hypothetical protein CONPUDRAFT_113510 [Coniophora puteana RWD-64-598 SS2]|uniref:Uncharacterized protein n=1 Tax=Coniophora puteana (strain RWD-64-598) TaxID=741705 RepID=R7SFH8_CONPW|nr:uncharacterized protein CONPUDRAFT_113510 [Coniophora puteana RWD-64-598 SS2]EIW74497.1 hypothetical protein CONPUDRAFT_113510 [Coniophora puteana RWD-64-598 SS2]